jgi:hypothetical protein
MYMLVDHRESFFAEESVDTEDRKIRRSVVGGSARIANLDNSIAKGEVLVDHDTNLGRDSGEEIARRGRVRHLVQLGR